ncbi:MAG: CZB domain-containing protein, partial [Desulfobacterales bacterium]|nr:CZB domain-containing protein [Desulfobacterales bacterium]
AVINETIAAAVEEQSATAGEIAKNITNSAQMAKNVSNLVFEASNNISEIADAMDKNYKAAQDVSTNIIEISDTTNEISRSLHEASSGSIDISKNIQAINESNKQVAIGASISRQEAKDLYDNAKKMFAIVNSFNIGKEKFNIAKIKAAHISWRSKLEGLLQGGQTLNANEVSSDRECSFGKWYFSQEGQQYKDNPVFKEIGSYHKDIHAFAKQMVEVYHQKKMEEAKNIMKKFENARVKLFKSLEDFYMQ